MLIKKNLKTERFISCPIVLKLKKQYRPPYFICKKRKEHQIPDASFFSSLSPAIEQALLKRSPSLLDTKRQAQKEKKILHFLYPTNFFNFQRKDIFSGSFYTRTAFFTLIESKKKKNHTFAPFAQPLKKKFQLKITLKSCKSQLEDIKVSVSAISKLIHFLNNCYTKQFKTLLTDSSHSPLFDLNSSFFNKPVKARHFSNALEDYPRVPSTFNLLRNFKIWMPLFEKKQNLTTQIPLCLNLLRGQPVIEFLEKPYKAKVKGQQKSNFSFLFSKLQKTNYCNRYFFKSSASLDNSGPINRQVQKTLSSTQLFTVIRSPFVFKKAREQFSLQKVFYNGAVYATCTCLRRQKIAQ